MLTEVVSYKLLIFKGMLSAYSDNGLVSAQCAIGGLACGLPPGHLLLEHVEQCHNISEAAAAFL